MATDATGTPTALGIPKYKTDVDIPSGKGFNAAMDAVDTLIGARVSSDAVTPAATRLVATKLLSADTQPAFRILGDGDLEWGAGGSTAPDTNLYRNAANNLKTDDTLDIDRPLTTDYALRVRAAAEANARFRISAGGVLDFGAGGGSEADTNLYRGAANLLLTDDDFGVALDMTARRGGSAQVNIGARGPASEAGITFGSALDTNLYRSAANVLKTDDAFQSAGLRANSGHIEASTGNIYLYAANPSVYFGSASDIRLYRSAAASLSFHDGTNTLMTVTNPAADHYVGLHVLVDIAGTKYSKQVHIGSLDSGGAGYRVLRVAN